MKQIFSMAMVLALSALSVLSYGRQKPGEVKLMTLDPGHFHAALVQKNMYSQVNPSVFVYAPKGADLNEHLKRIEGFNSRAENPTSWNEIVYSGRDYFEKMLSEKPGNVVVIAGNNRIKTEYIKKSVEAGLNVLADKPMVITPENFPVLEQSFRTATAKGVLLYDIMTERYEINNLLQRELSQVPALFGKLQSGKPDKPAVENLSVHYFYKEVSGSPLVRPVWSFDVKQQGEGIVDVSTHLVDLIQWGCFPEQIIHKSDIRMISAKRWPTIFTPADFKSVTQSDKFPDYLKGSVKNGMLNVFSNGQMIYKIKGVFAKVSVEWKYKAPEGAGDTYFSIMRGTNCSLEISQNKEEKYDPTLYVNAGEGTDLKKFETTLIGALKNSVYKGLSIKKVSDTRWKVIIPDQYKVGPEARFSLVTEKFLEYLKDGKMPEWEVPDMIAKYYTTTTALKLALKRK